MINAKVFQSKIINMNIKKIILSVKKTFNNLNYFIRWIECFSSVNFKPSSQMHEFLIGCLFEFCVTSNIKHILNNLHRSSLVKKKLFNLIL